MNLEIYIIVRGTLECCERRNTAETKLTNHDRINTTLQVFKSPKHHRNILFSQWFTRLHSVKTSTIFHKISTSQRFLLPSCRYCWCSLRPKTASDWQLQHTTSHSLTVCICWFVKYWYNCKLARIMQRSLHAKFRSGKTTARHHRSVKNTNVAHVHSS